jgi:hypothetical protein
MLLHDRNRTLAGIVIVAAAVWGAQCGSNVDAPRAPPGPPLPVASGTLSHWPEATAHLRVDADGAGAAHVTLTQARPPGMGAYWSVASTEGGGSGFFYAERPAMDAGAEPDAASLVAQAVSVQRVQEIDDASQFDYSHDVIGPVPASGIVLVQNLASRRYLAIVIDAIDPADPRTAGAGPYAYADIHWYLTSEGSASFAAAP